MPDKAVAGGRGGTTAPSPNRPRAPRTGPAGRPGVGWTLPGFAPMTRISTSFGEVHAQALRVRDMVRTRAGGYAQIVWVDRLNLDEEFLTQNPDALPVTIRAGSLGRGMPKADVVVSPRQSVCPYENRLLGNASTAADLLNKPGVFRTPETATTYTLFHCGKPVLVQSEGMWLAAVP